ncbi:MAG: hypothetical protein JST93_11940 [Acidobacteria bacterium]|nr:hypothetical protein [Acidobacteriota bacterium]
MRTRCLALIAVFCCDGLFGQGTSDFLDAPVAKNIRLQLSGDGKSLQWVIPEKSEEGFQALPANKLFLTNRVVNVTFLKPNPLRVKLKASSKSVADPAAATMSDLISTFLNMVNVVAPGSPGLAELLKTAKMIGSNAAPSHACSTLPEQLDTLSDSLEASAFTPKAVGAEVERWAKAIDDAYATNVSGPAAVGKGIEALKEGSKKWKDPITAADEAIKKIRACAESTVEGPTTRVDFVAQPKAKPVVPEIPKPLGNAPTAPELEQFRVALKARADKEKELEEWQAEAKKRQDYLDYENKKAQADTLGSLRLHAITVILGNPAQRVSTMKTVVAKAEEVEKQLTAFRDSDAWVKDRRGNVTADYVMLRGVAPTFEKMEEVTVEVTPITYQPDAESFSVKEAKAIGGTMTVRRFSRFAVEPAVGAVFATVTQPKYAAGTNDKGQTIVTRTDDAKISFTPSAMVNFVCRCGTSRISPLIQMGAAASKDTPGALVGAGFRLFGGKSGLAIGGGAMFAWVKDLKTLQVNQVVSSAAAIEQDRGFRTRPSVGGYFAIQYQF